MGKNHRRNDIIQKNKNYQNNKRPLLEKKDNPVLIKNENSTNIGNPNHLDKIRHTIFYIPDKIMFKLELPRGLVPERRYVFEYKNYLDTQLFPDIRLSIIEKKKLTDKDETNNPVLIESEKKVNEDFKKRSTTFSMLVFPRFLNELNILLTELKSPDLFKYDDNDQLIVNQNIGKKYVHKFKSSFDDITISPYVVEDIEKVKYEGIKISLTDDLGKDHDAYLTYDELYATYWNLNNIDVQGMALDLYLRLYYRPVKIDNRPNRR